MPDRTDMASPSPSDPLDFTGLDIQPGTHVVGSIVVLSQTGSTNDVCRHLAEAGSIPVAVVADHQTAGRGRFGRSWTAPPGKALLFSVAIPHDRLPYGVAALGPAALLAVVDAVRDTAVLHALAKWPNDVVVGGRKLAGVLIENHDRFAVVGVGVNVWQAPEDFPPDLRASATSVFASGGRSTGRAALLDVVLRRMSRRLHQHPRSLLLERSAVELVLGRRLEVRVGNEVVRGTGVRLDADGALVVCFPDGREQRLLAGDVSIRLDKEEPYL
ncbi:MAG: biotin--[acetyl-CoA-carboxylase] ligase [Armatimonadota bacterium]